jgi:hypothetical protein
MRQMRQAIRRIAKDGHRRRRMRRWHEPALAEFGPANAKRGFPQRPKPQGRAHLGAVDDDRLSFRSGYGASISSPGWYDHLYRHQNEQVLVRWLAKTARLLRKKDVDISSAHVIEAVRLAEALAALRERPLAGAAGAERGHPRGARPGRRRGARARRSSSSAKCSDASPPTRRPYRCRPTASASSPAAPATEPAASARNPFVARDAPLWL